MKTRRAFLSGLLALVVIIPLLWSGYPALESRSDRRGEISSGPTVTLHAASGASVGFREQDGPRASDVSPNRRKVPHLVLRRNGALTAPEERTLIMELSGIRVPPAGAVVTIEVETQHGDPDVADSQRRIAVWRAVRWIANPSGLTRTEGTMVFTHTFRGTIMSSAETIAMPTDYFRYEIAVIDAIHRTPFLSLEKDHAFLMENQEIASLPEVREAAPGAAPDELIVYYCDMFPFQKDTRDPDTWLAREDVPHFVADQLVPEIVEAFRAQSDDWGFTWYSAWTSYRTGEDAERLSVALSDGRTWFHGRAPQRGNSYISISVAGGDNASYDSLIEGLMSSFHHELFHNLQRNLNLGYGGDGTVDGAEDAWQFFSEGTAVMASSVGQPDAQFRWQSRAYLSKANGFLGYGGQINNLNSSYARLNPYHTALYWRFLYEQCGENRAGTVDPAVGMAVIRRALTILYSGEVVDISTSTDLVRALPKIIDRALSGSSCPFDTHAESLAAFTRAVYALQLENGRCVAPSSPAGCGLYDPYNRYAAPRVSMVTHSEEGEQYAGDIPTSFGLDFVDVVLDPATDGWPLTLEFQAAPGGAAEFTVQVWELKDQGERTAPQPVPTPTSGPTRLKATARDGRLSYVVPVIDRAKSNRVALLISRVDANERVDSVGRYTIVMR